MQSFIELARQILDFVSQLIGRDEFLFIVEIISCSIKLYFFIALSYYTTQYNKSKNFIYLLLIVLGGSIFSDAAWIVKIIKVLFIPSLDKRIIAFISRIAWASVVLRNQALLLFLQYLINKSLKPKISDYVWQTAYASLFFSCIIIAIIQFNTPNPEGLWYIFEVNIIQICSLSIIPSIVPILFRIYQALKSNAIPKILKHQLRTFIMYMIVPYYLLTFISKKSFLFVFIRNLVHVEQNTLVCLTTLLSTYMVYYGSKYIMRLRFLNLNNQVSIRPGFDFINDFKDILEQLSQVSSMNELAHLTQTFFKSAFAIKTNRTKLHIRKQEKTIDEKEINYDAANIAKYVESFIAHPESIGLKLATHLQQAKILIKDEIEFTNFYDAQADFKIMLEFLDTINADIFLPIYEKQNIVAYVIIEKNSRDDALYSSSERDEMVVFASYMANIISILKHSNLDALIKREKELKEELYLKHQESNQYRESLRSFIRSTKDRKIGILFYKGRKLTIANQSAQDIINFDIQNQEGHPLAKTIRTIAKKAQEFKSSQLSHAKDTQGNKLIVSAIPSIDNNSVIVMVYYPEISDIIKYQFDLLKDPSHWDYLLYLETTQSGKLVSQLIPGAGEKLLAFKISLLATAFSKKATLLDIPEDDLLPTVEILHHISLRKTLHTIKLTAAEKNDEVALKLFGINPIFGSKELSQSLLEKLDNTGTLFIENIHYLSIETQNALANFISYGFYYRLKSDYKQFSNVRVICSSTKNLDILAKEGLFSKALINELNKTTIIMPSLATLTQEEISHLVDGFTEQALKTTSFKTLLELSPKDRDKLLNERPMSLVDFKNKIHQLLMQKSTKNHIHDKIEFDPAYHISDPELIDVVRLGKKALKDPQLLKILWQKFKNQNKIATLLGVNRSSVNRRCKEYNLTE